MSWINDFINNIAQNETLKNASNFVNQNVVQPVSNDLNPANLNAKAQLDAQQQWNAQNPVNITNPSTYHNLTAVDPQTKQDIALVGGVTGGDIGGEEAIAQKGPGLLKKLIGGYDPIDQIQASNAMKNSRAYSVTTPQIQDAYRRNGIKDPLQVNAVKQMLYDKIVNPLTQNSQIRLPLGDTVGGEGIVPQIVKEMQNMHPAIDQHSAEVAASNIRNRLYDIARNETGLPTPNDISLKGVLDYKTLLNQAIPVQKAFSGELPTDINDIATVAARNVLQNTLEKNAPAGVTQAIKDYGLLEEGFPSFLKAVENPQPGQVMKTLKNPFVQGGLGALGITEGGNIAKGLSSLAGDAVGVGGIALGRMGNALDALEGKSQSDAANNSNQNMSTQSKPVDQLHNDNIISQSYSDISPDPKTGNIELPAAPQSEARHYMTENEYLQSPNNPTLQKTYEADQTQANTVLNTNNVRGFMAQAPRYNADGNSLRKTLSAMPTDFWNGVGKAGSIKSYTDPAYAQELQQIDQFNTEFAAAYKSVTGEDPKDNQILDSANSPQQAAVKLKAMQQFIAGAYRDYLDPWLAVTTPAGAQTNQGMATTNGQSPAYHPLGGGLPPLSGNQGLANPIPAFIPKGQGFENGTP